MRAAGSWTWSCWLLDLELLALGPGAAGSWTWSCWLLDLELQTCRLGGGAADREEARSWSTLSGGCPPPLQPCVSVGEIHRPTLQEEDEKEESFDIVEYIFGVRRGGLMD